MRIGSLITAMAGIAIAGGSTYLARNYLTPQPQSVEIEAAAPATVPVVIASSNIAFGQLIEPTVLTTIEWPVGSVPAGAYNDYDMVLPGDGQEPRRAKRPFTKGDIILAAKLSEYGEKVTITQTLDKSRRAMAISVSATTSVGGFVTPGDFVDIMLTSSRSGGDIRAFTILQNIRIIGIDQMADENNDSPQIARTVTVDVSPEEAQKLLLAQNAGRLSLTLRSIENDEDAPLQSTRLSDILQDESPNDDVAPRQVIKVRRGIQISDTDVTVQVAAETDEVDVTEPQTN